MEKELEKKQDQEQGGQRENVGKVSKPEELNIWGNSGPLRFLKGEGTSKLENPVGCLARVVGIEDIGKSSKESKKVDKRGEELDLNHRYRHCRIGGKLINYIGRGAF